MSKEETGSTAIFTIRPLDVMILAWSRAANRDRDLLAHHPRDTARHGVGLLSSNTTGHLDRLCVVDRLAHGVGNLSGANLRLVAAHRVRNFLFDAFRDHVTDPIADRLHALLGNHVANLVDARLDHLLGHHATRLVGERLDALLMDHVANLVDARFDAVFRNHVALAIRHRLDTRFGNHVADLVGANLGSRFRDVPANRVRYRFGHHIVLVTDAIHDLGVHLGDPDLLADLARGALNSDGVRLAGYIHAAATARIPGPAARFLDALVNHRTRDFGDLRFPASAANLNRLRVGDRTADRAANLTMASLIDRLADIVTNRVATRFPDRPTDRVVDVTRTGFPHRFVNGVADILRPRFPDRRADRVADILRVRVPDRGILRVANVFRTRFPDGHANGVADFLGASLPDRFANIIGARLVVRLVDWLLNGILARLVVCFRYVAHALDRLAIVNRIVDRLVAGVLLLLVDHLFAGLHDGVTLLLSTVVLGRMNAGTMAVTGRAKIGRGGRVDRCKQHQGRNYRHTPKRFHVVPFLC